MITKTKHVDIDLVRFFEENVMLLIVGIWCPVCDEEHMQPPPVRLGSKDSIRFTCPKGYVVTFKVEKT